MRWLVFLAACGATQPQPLENRPRPSSDDLSFLAGCWQRLDGGVLQVRWTRDEHGWSGHYEQRGPMDVRVRATLAIRRTDHGLAVETTETVCDSSTCLAPFDVEGTSHAVRDYTVFGTGDSALWLGFDRGRGELLFGQAEAKRFTRCDDGDDDDDDRAGL